MLKRCQSSTAKRTTSIQKALLIIEEYMINQTKSIDQNCIFDLKKILCKLGNEHVSHLKHYQSIGTHKLRGMNKFSNPKWRSLLAHEAKGNVFMVKVHWAYRDLKNCNTISE
jgi:hypothetical protein